MPTPEGTREPGRRPGPIALSAVLQGLDAAHATVTALTSDPDTLCATIGTASVSVKLLGNCRHVRQIVDDLGAQLDAVEASR
jgi:hypothetical protein